MLFHYLPEAGYAATACATQLVCVPSVQNRTGFLSQLFLDRISVCRSHRVSCSSNDSTCDPYVVLTVLPVLQMILLYLNGGMLYILALPFGDFLGDSDLHFENSINAILSLIGVLGFYLAKNKLKRGLFTFLTFFSGQSIFYMLTERLFTEYDNYYLICSMSKMCTWDC